MSWLDEMVHDAAGALRKGGPGTTVNAMGLEMIVRRAIRETIEKCVECVPVGTTRDAQLLGVEARTAIRKLSET